MLGWLFQRKPVRNRPLEDTLADMLFFHTQNRETPEFERNAWGIPLVISARMRMLMAMTEVFPCPPSNAKDFDPDGGWPEPSAEEQAALDEMVKEGLARIHCDGMGLCEWHLTKKAGHWYRPQMFEDMAKLRRERLTAA